MSQIAKSIPTNPSPIETQRSSALQKGSQTKHQPLQHGQPLHSAVDGAAPFVNGLSADASAWPPMFQHILDNLPLAIFWKDHNSVYQGCNQSFAKDAGLDSVDQICGRTDNELAWTREQAASFRHIDQQVMQSGEMYHDTKEVVAAHGDTFWVETTKVPLYSSTNPDDSPRPAVGILGTYRNISHRKEAQEALRTSQEMLQLVMDNIPQFIFWKDRNSTYLGSNRNFAQAAGVHKSEELIGKTDHELSWLNDEAILCRSVDEKVMETDQPELHKTEQLLMADGKHAWVDVNKIPLHDGAGNVVGVLGTYEDITERLETQDALKNAHDELEQRVKERTAELSQANILLQQEVHERKQIEAIEREQRAWAEALRDTAALLNSTLDLDEVLDRILTAIGRVVLHNMANIVLIESNEARVVRHRSTANLTIDKHSEEKQSRGNIATETELANGRFPIETEPVLKQMNDCKRALIINDISVDTNDSTRIIPQWGRSYLGSPIFTNGEITGFVNLYSDKQNFFTDLHGERLQAFVNQAAAAIQNARLYERAQDLAALEERQRLARDLHDAVSQTLWTASLMADVLPTLWEENPQEGKEVLNKFRRLNRGALAEMRSLLLELRPTTLVEAQLDDLMEQLAEAMMSRKKIDVSFAMHGTPFKLPTDTHIALYRVAQESLNNIAKHSRATEVQIHLSYLPSCVTLAIQDNGCGFDQAQLSQQRLGMGIMQERAHGINAELQIDSHVDEGTTVQMRWCTDGQNP